MSTVPTRPVLRYHGGKWRIAPWIISHFPAHRVYVEPFGGGGSVLLRKPRSFAECYNDVDGEVVNVFRVLRDPALAEQLRRACVLTPWSRTEFWACYGPISDDAVERARMCIYRSFAAHGSTHRSGHRTGFRARAWSQNRTGPGDWCNWPDQVHSYIDRLRGVVIESRHAFEIIEQQDSPDTLFYVDPPYPLSTRTSVRWRSESDAGRAYVANLTDDEHRQLAGLLHSIAGMVVLSGYPCELYDDELYPDWQRSTKRAMAEGARVRTEVLWINPAAANVLQTSLFAPRAP